MEHNFLNLSDLGNQYIDFMLGWPHGTHAYPYFLFFRGSLFLVREVGWKCEHLSRRFLFDQVSIYALNRTNLVLLDIVYMKSYSTMAWDILFLPWFESSTTQPEQKLFRLILAPLEKSRSIWEIDIACCTMHVYNCGTKFWCILVTFYLLNPEEVI